MTWRLSHTSTIGIGLLLLVAVVLLLFHLWWASGYCVGFAHAYLAAVYTARRALTSPLIPSCNRARCKPVTGAVTTKSVTHG